MVHQWYTQTGTPMHTMETESVPGLINYAAGNGPTKCVGNHTHTYVERVSCFHVINELGVNQTCVGKRQCMMQRHLLAQTVYCYSINDSVFTFTTHKLRLDNTSQGLHRATPVFLAI